MARKRGIGGSRRDLGPAARRLTPGRFTQSKLDLGWFQMIRAGDNPVAPDDDQTETDTFTGTTEAVITFAQPTTTDNGIVVCFALKGGIRVDTLTDNYGNTYTLGVEAVDEDDAVAELWYAKNIVAGATHTLTATFATPADGMWGAIELSKVAKGNAFWDGAAAASFVRAGVGSSASVAVTSGRPSATNEFIVAFLSLAGGGTDAGITTPPGFTEFALENDYSNIAAGEGASKLQPTRTPVTATWTTDTTTAPAAAIIAAFRGLGVKPASGPVNTILPSISGELQVTETLTASTGTWSGSPTSYAYQWYADDVAIGGATSSTYTLQEAQEGAFIRVRVTATNPADSTNAFSASVGPVAAAPEASVLPGVGMQAVADGAIGA